MYKTGLPYSKSISYIKSSHILATLNGLGISYGDQSDITLESPILLLPGQSVYKLSIDDSFSINKAYLYNKDLNTWSFTYDYKLSSGNIKFPSKLKNPVLLFPTVVLETLFDTNELFTIIPLTLVKIIPACYTDISLKVNKRFQTDINYEFSFSPEGPWSVEIYSHKYFSTVYMRMHVPSTVNNLVIVPCDLLELSCLVS